MLVTKFSYWLRKMEIQQQVKNKLMHGLSDEEITILAFQKKDIKKLLRWEHEREFEYKSMMYDIVKIEETNDSITYHCWADFEESELYHQIKKEADLESNHDPVQKHNNQLQIEFFKILYFENIKSYFLLSDLDFKIPYVSNFKYLFVLLNRFDDLQTDPPESNCY